jgi:hypothetical protein
MNNSNVYGGVFCTPDERQVCAIGTGYLANFVSGGSGARAGATLTNKRVYFSGIVYTFIGRKLAILSRRQIVNTRDITGTGYDFYRPIRYIIMAVLSLILLPVFGLIMRDNWGGGFTGFAITFGIILFIVFLVTYFNKRRTLMFVEYAGGNIAFNVQWIQKHEQDDFIRNIHLVKDNLYSNAAEAQGFVTAESLVDVIPEL